MNIDILKRVGLWAGGLPALSEMYNGWMATATAAAATATATKAAVSGSQHMIVGFDVSIRDDALGADTYIKVELIEDVNDTAVVIGNYHFSFDVDAVGQVDVPHIDLMFPCPVHVTSGLSISAKVTVAVAADAVNVNLYGVTK